MQANRRRDTAAELAVRQRLFATGLRYRVDYRVSATVRARADIVFPALRIAVFIDGCFWHCCPEHGVMPQRNAEYWTQKLEGNVARDRVTDDVLRSEGWLVRRFWEHEPADAVALKIIEDVRVARSRRSG